MLRMTGTLACTSTNITISHGMAAMTEGGAIKGDTRSLDYSSFDIALAAGPVVAGTMVLLVPDCSSFTVDIDDPFASLMPATFYALRSSFRLIFHYPFLSLIYYSSFHFIFHYPHMAPTYTQNPYITLTILVVSPFFSILPI